MTIYMSFKGGVNSKRSRRLHFRWKDQKTRASFAFHQQYKRYPHCRNILDIRGGAKTNTYIYSDGHDRFYRAKDSLGMSITGLHYWSSPDICTEGARSIEVGGVVDRGNAIYFSVFIDRQGEEMECIADRPTFEDAYNFAKKLAYKANLPLRDATQ